MKQEIKERICDYEKHIADVAIQGYANKLRGVMEDENMDSPIEQLYIATLLYMEAIGKTNKSIKIFPQFKVGKYRADFMLVDTIVNKNGCDEVFNIIVELDSYQFHNRNAKQHTYEKKREREMQKAGYSIIRFSGSEVVNDPVKCVSETIDALYKNCVAAVF